jgi:DNA-binding protein
MHISYDSQIVDHDNDNKPIKNETIHRYLKLNIQNDKFLACSADWEIYSYEDVKGVEKIFDYFSGNKLNFTFGNLEAIKCYMDNSVTRTIELNKNGAPQYYKFISSFELKNELYGINIYKRKKKSLMDYAANIASLCATIYSIMSKAFGFIYSRNFDTYKIVENILSKGSKALKIKEIELSDNVKNGTNSLDSDLNNNFIGKDNEIKDFNNDFNDNDTDNFIENEEISRNNENDNVSVKLPKLRMYDFFFNNVYSPKCCVTLKKQKLLSSCENVLFKYFSVENILYNQIIFENLMKDYKWNNLKLKSIQKNDLIIEIKKYI